MALPALAWVALPALAWVALPALAWVALPAPEEGAGLRPEEGAEVSSLLRQPRYQIQEVRVPFERIGSDRALLMPGKIGARGLLQVL